MVPHRVGRRRESQGSESIRMEGRLPRRPGAAQCGGVAGRAELRHAGALRPPRRSDCAKCIKTPSRAKKIPLFCSLARLGVLANLAQTRQMIAFHKSRGTNDMSPSRLLVPCLIGIALLLSRSPIASAANRPNILFIMSDDHAAHAMS